MIAMVGGMISWLHDVRFTFLHIPFLRHPTFGNLADRGSVPPREDLPLPTQPPYTAFIGNLTFDLTEMELEEFFGSSKVRRSLPDNPPESFD
jgi:hypothetical protein